MSLKTKDEVYDYVVKETKNFCENKSFRCTAEKVSHDLSISRSLASHYLNEFVKDGFFIKINSRPVCFLDKTQIQENFCIRLEDPVFDFREDFLKAISSGENKKIDFEKAVGYRSSLSHCVMQCRSAIHYPLGGLPILLLGETGTGKEFFSKLMYEYAVNHKILEENAPYLIFRPSAQDSENDEELLFGRIAPDQAGQPRYIPGLIHKAEAGILYISDVENLSQATQLGLSRLIRTGCYSPSGHYSMSKKSTARLVFSTSRDPETALMNDLYTHIPVIAEFPSLSERYREEKEEFIINFFRREQKKIKKNVFISCSVLDALLDHVFAENIDGISKAVKNCCANAFIDCGTAPDSSGLNIKMRHLPDEILSAMQNMSEIDTKQPMIEISTFKKADRAPALISILERTKENFIEYRNHRIDYNTFIDAITRDVTSYNDYFVFTEKITNNRIKMIEGIIERLTGETAGKYNILIPKNYEYILSRILYHSSEFSFLLSTWEEENQKILEELQELFQDNLKDIYTIASELDDNIRNLMGGMSCRINVIYSALTISQYNRDFIDRKYIGIIISHGYSTASSIADAANTLIGKHIFDGIDMPLNSSLEETVVIVNEHLKKRNGRKDIIILVDMGSLEEIGDIISRTTSVNIGVINNISTLVAFNAGMEMNRGLRMEEIFDSICNENNYRYKIIPGGRKKNAILVISEIGYSTAEKVAALFRKSLPASENNIEIVPYAYADLSDKKDTAEIFRRYNVLFVIGTTKIPLSAVPFVSLEDVIAFRDIEQINQLLLNHLTAQEVDIFSRNLLANFSLENVIQNITILNPYVLLQYVKDAVDSLRRSMGITLTNRIIVGVYVHLCCLIERLVTKDEYRTHEDLERFREEHGDFIRMFQISFSEIISHYKIEIPVSEMAYIYDYIENNE